MIVVKDNEESNVFTPDGRWLPRTKYEKELEEANKEEEEKPVELPKQHYGQIWSAYNKAQTTEKHFIMKILNELLFNIKESTIQRKGRPSVPLRDQIFSMCLHQYSGLSSRRTNCEIKDAQRKHYLLNNIHFNTLLSFYDNPLLTNILKNLIELSSKPLSFVENHFSVDSSGFSIRKYARWFDAKYNKQISRRMFKKAHITSGAKTNIISAVNITEGTSADCPQLPDLLQRTANNFNITEVSADKAYLSRENLRFINNLGATPFIPFKSNSIGKSRGCSFWRNAYLFFRDNYDEFSRIYHLRSNVESTFSMIKRKLNVQLRTLKETSQTNEILAKCLVHNLCVLCMEFYTLGINVQFE
jgi:transposase